MNPYEKLSARAFWKPAVGSRHPSQIEDIWDPKWSLTPEEPVATFGSCFAQHIGRSLASRGYNWLITEPPPHKLSAADERSFNYSLFTARTGNIYTAGLLKQWMDWSLGKTEVPEEIWHKDGRYFDPFRPRIEPDGFESEEELIDSRLTTLRAMRECLETSSVFVFTLGLTESWFNKQGKYEYPLCPGTAAGEFDPASHRFVNAPFLAIFSVLSEVMATITSVNPSVRFLLTVSPVPLTATKSGAHVLVATMHSKSILRAVAGQLAQQRANVDYFPSYEIISSPCFGGWFFETNRREVSAAGVNFVMDTFFRSLEKQYGKPPISRSDEAAPADHAVNCEEEILAAFGSGA